jgi:RNA polymerase sigma-70 factor (ECF subfamily)
MRAGSLIDDLRATVASAAAGDVDSLAAIVTRHHRDMARVCAVITGDPDLAEEAVQAAWPIAWRRLGTLRDPDRLRAWLVSIAANEARQLLRRERRRRVVELAIAAPISTGIDDHASLADLDRALARLGPDDRALLALRYVAELGSDEIGRALGISGSGARSRLERLLTRLRTELRDE